MCNLCKEKCMETNGERTDRQTNKYCYYSSIFCPFGSIESRSAQVRFLHKFLFIYTWLLKMVLEKAWGPSWPVKKKCQKTLIFCLSLIIDQNKTIFMTYVISTLWHHWGDNLLHRYLFFIMISTIFSITFKDFFRTLILGVKNAWYQIKCYRWMIHLVTPIHLTSMDAESEP